MAAGSRSEDPGLRDALAARGGEGSWVLLADPEVGRSAPALIAEGYDRWTRPEFIRYLRLAKGELGETRNHVKDAADTKLIDVVELRELSRLCYRASRACEGLIVSLLRKIKDEQKRGRKRSQGKGT